MKTAAFIFIAVLVALPAFAGTYFGNSDWTQPFETDPFTLGLWHFDQNAGDTVVPDSSGNNNDGTLLTGLANQFDPNLLWDTSKAGFGNCVNTTNGGWGNIKVEQGTNTTLSQPNGGSDLTIEAWVNIPDFDSWGRLVQKYTGGPYCVRYNRQDQAQPGALDFYFWEGAPVNNWSNVSDTGGPLPLNTWTHIAVCINRSGYYNDVVTFFVNGQFMSSHETARSGINDSEPLWMLSNHNADAWAQWEGKVDELRISSVIRYTKDPVAVPEHENFLQPFQPDEYTLVLWHFDNQPGDTMILDSTPYGHNGALDNGLAQQLDPDISWAPSIPGFGNCLYTWYRAAPDRNWGRVDVDQDSVTGNDWLTGHPNMDLTIEFWIWPGKYPAGARQSILNQYTGGPYGVRLWNDFQSIFFQYWSPGGWYQVIDATILPLKTWAHVAILIDRNTYPDKDVIRFFINGQFSSQHEVAVGGYYDGAHDMILFNAVGNTADGAFQGKLDELRVSNILRNYGGLNPTPNINRVKKIGDDLQFEFASANNRVYGMLSADSLYGPWSNLIGLNGLADTTQFTDVNALVGVDQKFYKVDLFGAESMGYAEIAAKSPVVDGSLAEWTAADVIAARNNFFRSYDGRFMPYLEGTVYGAYNESDNAFYFAFSVETFSSSDMVELVFCTPADTTAADGIQLDRTSGLSFTVFEDTVIHPRWDTGEGDTYTAADFTAAGGVVAQSVAGGMWNVEIKVPYGFIADGYAFSSGTQQSVNFNWGTDWIEFPQYGAPGAWFYAKLATTSPNKSAWPTRTGKFEPNTAYGDDPPRTYEEPGAGVSRP